MTSIEMFPARQTFDRTLFGLLKIKNDEPLFKLIERWQRLTKYKVMILEQHTGKWRDGSKYAQVYPDDVI